MIPSASSFSPGWPINPDSATTATFSLSGDQKQARRREIRRLTQQVAAQLQARMSTTFPPVEALVTEGLTRLHAAIQTYRSGRTIDDLTAVQLGLDLQIIRIRDEAWIALDSSPTLHTDLGLWEDLSEIVDRECLPPISSLVAFMAWRHNRPDIAHNAALAALKIDPFYQLAHFVDTVVHNRTPSSRCAPIVTIAAQLRPDKSRPACVEPLRQKVNFYTRSRR